MSRREPTAALLAGALVIAGAALARPHGDLLAAGASPGFWWGFGVAGAGYLLAWRAPPRTVAWLLAVALVARLVLLGMAPGDDVWRYLWEGYVQHHGVDPYRAAPGAPELSGLRTAWWPLINHRHVTAIYPPLAQVVFRLATWPGSFDVDARLLALKALFATADLLVAALLAARLGPRRAVVYAWSPLVVYASAGGGHLDSLFLLPLVGAWLALEAWPGHRGRLAGALLLGVSVAIKWVSLPLVGLLGLDVLRRRRIREAVAIGLLGLAPLVASAYPFCGRAACPLVPIGSDFVVSGRSAELGPWLLGAIGITPRTNAVYLMPLAALCLVLAWRRASPAVTMEAYLLGLLVLSPVVHGWYFTWLIPFAAARDDAGGRLLGLTAFVYFVLPGRLIATGSWELTALERLVLWGPLLAVSVSGLVSALRAPPVASLRRAR